MAGKRGKKDSDTRTADNGEYKDTAPSGSETDDVSIETGSSEEVKGSDLDESRRGLFFPILRRKWTLLFLLMTILAITGLGLRYSPELLDRIAMESHIITLSNTKDENLKEEALDPFFIPLRTDSPLTVVRIDLSVICDGLASVILREKRLQIRDRLYRDLAALSKGKDDLNSDMDYLEMKISMTFREVLGLQNLFIRIKEIKYF